MKSASDMCPQCQVLATKVAALEAEQKRVREQLAAAKKTSSTSSKPPSSDIVKPKPPERPDGQKRSIGGQPGHVKHAREPMKFVNACILGAIFGLLERIELIHGVEFARFDPNDEKDVNVLAENYIQPTIKESSVESREMIRLAIAYYTTFGVAPIQQMKDRCQELTLPDANSWELFFSRIGMTLFGNEFKSDFNCDDYVERPSDRECESLFRRN